MKRSKGKGRVTIREIRRRKSKGKQSGENGRQGKSLKWKSQTIKMAAAILTGTLILSLGLFFLDRPGGLPLTADGQPYLERNNPGKGSKKESLTVQLKGEEETQVDIELQEQSRSKEELWDLLEQEADELEKLILGENESLEEVHTDLKLITKIPESDTVVAWKIEDPEEEGKEETDDEEYMDITGKLNPDKLTRQGKLLELTATLTQEEEQLSRAFPIRICAGDNGEDVSKKAAETVQRDEAEHREEKKVVLPTQQDGKTLVWKRTGKTRWLTLLMLGIAAVGLIFLREKETDKKEKEKKEKQMLLDYPEIINKFTIYTGAGMTIRKAWEKIVLDYEKNIRGNKKRYAYEQMRITYHELESGGSERECYERFGERCRLQPYLKLGALLSQNLRKGAKGLSELLRTETHQAFEDRKATALRLGEEAGTKLLLPMFLMLAVVLVVIMVPAFLSIQL